VEKQIQYIEEEITRMERIPSYLTQQNIDHAFKEIRKLVWSWYFDKLPRKHRLRDHVEDTMVKRIEILRAKLRR
jgi:hypothetical protein